MGSKLRDPDSFPTMQRPALTIVSTLQRSDPKRLLMIRSEHAGAQSSQPSFGSQSCAGTTTQRSRTLIPRSCFLQSNIPVTAHASSCLPAVPSVMPPVARWRITVKPMVTDPAPTLPPQIRGMSSQDVSAAAGGSKGPISARTSLSTDRFDSAEPPTEMEEVASSARSLEYRSEQDAQRQWGL